MQKAIACAQDVSGASKQAMATKGTLLHTIMPCARELLGSICGLSAPLTANHGRYSRRKRPDQPLRSRRASSSAFFESGAAGQVFVCECWLGCWPVLGCPPKEASLGNRRKQWSGPTSSRERARAHELGWEVVEWTRPLSNGAGLVLGCPLFKVASLALAWRVFMLLVWRLYLYPPSLIEWRGRCLLSPLSCKEECSL